MFKRESPNRFEEPKYHQTYINNINESRQSIHPQLGHHDISPTFPAVNYKLPSLSETLPEFFPKNGRIQSPERYGQFTRYISYDNERQVYKQDSFPASSMVNFEKTSHVHLPFCDEEIRPRPRPRRRFEEVERLYACIYQGCHKAYGALNHLNSHIVSKGHGKKRLPSEFEEMRRGLKIKAATTEQGLKKVQPICQSYSPEKSISVYQNYGPEIVVSTGCDYSRVTYPR